MKASSLNCKFNEEFDINDKYMRLKKKSIRKLISLPPKYLGNLTKGIEEEIFKQNQEIIKEFNGVPISMGKKKLLQNVGTCIDDHAFIQFYVDIECVVFTPKVGKKVKAVINKIGETYVGCLICNRINATIFKQSKINNIKEVDNEDLNKLIIGQTILIKIKSIQYEANNLFIIATLDKALD